MEKDALSAFPDGLGQQLLIQHDYASHEQIEIDKLVYEAYGLNENDIREVENWYARRYPRLVAAPKENLRKPGKCDDYLELYREVGRICIRISTLR